MEESRRRKRKKRAIKAWVKFILFIVVVASVIFLLKSPIFNVSQYRIIGNSYYTKDEILNMGNCSIGGNIFIGINGGDIENRLEQDPYMKKVRVKRKLPNIIEIQLDERRQTAAVVYGEKFIVIDNEGTVLRKTSVRPDLTILRGITISKLVIGETIEAEERIQLRQAMDILNIMEENNMYFTELEMKKDVIVAHILKNLVCKGQPTQLMDTLKSKALSRVVKELFDLGIEKGTIKISGDNYISFTEKREW